MNPFDWSSDAFAVLYLACLVVALMLLGMVPHAAARSWVREPFPNPRALGPYEIAFLSGGPRAAIDTGAVALLHEGRIRCEGGQLIALDAPSGTASAAATPYRQASGEVAGDALEPFERSLADAIARAPGSLQRLHRLAGDPARRLAERLYGLGLVVSPDARRRVFAFGLAPLYLLTVIGSLRVYLDIRHERPGVMPSFLVFTGIFAALVMRPSPSCDTGRRGCSPSKRRRTCPGG